MVEDSFINIKSVNYTMTLRYYKAGEKPVKPNKKKEVDWKTRFPPLVVDRRTGMEDPSMAAFYFSEAGRNVCPYTGIKRNPKK